MDDISTSNMVNRGKSKTFVLRVIPANCPSWYRARGNWLNHITCKRSLVKKVGIDAILRIFSTELNELKESGCLVFDGFREEYVTVKVDLFGIMGDLVAKMEAAGFSAGGWSNLYRWCCYCYGSSDDKMKTEPLRMREKCMKQGEMTKRLTCKELSLLTTATRLQALKKDTGIQRLSILFSISSFEPRRILFDAMVSMSKLDLT